MGVVLGFPAWELDPLVGVDVVPVSMKWANFQREFYRRKKKTGPPVFVLPGLRGWLSI